MRSHYLNKIICLSFLSLVSFGSLASCNTDKINTDDGNTDEIEPLDALEKAYLAKNYTLNISDSDGDFDQYFLKDFYCFKFENQSYYTGYKEDENGIYKILANDDEVTSVGYYDVDSYTGEATKGLYENVTYSLSDLTLLPKLYRNINGAYYIRDTESDEAKTWLYLCGFSDDGSVGGVTPSKVDEMCFYINDEKDIEFRIVFNKSLEKDDTVITIRNVGETEEPRRFKEYFANGGTGKTYLPTNDDLYKYLGYLRNMYNYTLKVKSYYTGNNESNNFEVISKYTKNAYYSTSSRESENDIGYCIDNNIVKEMLLDGITGNAVIGSNVTDSDGKTYSSITDVVYSLKDLYWNDYVFEASKNSEKNYTIENKSFIANIANLLDETFFRFEIPNLTFIVNGEGSEQTYQFIVNLYNGDYLTLDIFDINKTTIGNL